MSHSNHLADLGLDPIGFDGEEYVVELEVADRHLNIGGIVHGGVVCSLLDTAMARSHFMATGGADLSAGTLEMNVNFFRSVRAGKLVARGRVVNQTRRTSYVEGSVFDDEGRLIAKASATMIVFAEDRSAG